MFYVVLEELAFDFSPFHPRSTFASCIFMHLVPLYRHSKNIQTRMCYVCMQNNYVPVPVKLVLTELP